MYDPKGNSRKRTMDAVHFVEAEPPLHLADVVHRFLELRTPEPLEEDYRFHALPDACTYAVFDQHVPEIAGITRLRASAEDFNLGARFHFVNIRFLPGVWQGARTDIGYGLVNTAYDGHLPLRAINADLQGQPFAAQVERLSAFVESLIDAKQVVPNPVAQAIFAAMDDIHSVADMAEAAGLSARQLQRVLKASTGFAPHDFLKVLRLQQSLRGEPSLSYADQSHFIHAFRRATGYTPGQYAKKFDL